jgi:hypothetical protein
VSCCNTSRVGRSGCIGSRLSPGKREWKFTIFCLDLDICRPLCFSPYPAWPKACAAELKRGRSPSAIASRRDARYAVARRRVLHAAVAAGVGRARAAHSPPDVRDDPALPPAKKVAKFASYSAVVTSAKCETSRMLRHCLIHPVAPVLSLLAPLFRPFFSPVRSVPDAANLPLKSLKCRSFAPISGPAPATKEFFSLLSRLKQGSERCAAAGRRWGSGS